MPKIEPDFVLPAPFNGIRVYVSEFLPYTQTDPETGESYEVHALMMEPDRAEELIASERAVLELMKRCACNA